MSARMPQYRDLGDPMARELHDDSAAEAQQSLMGKHEMTSWSDEQNSELGDNRAWASKPARLWSYVSRFRWLLDIALILVIVGLVVDRSSHKQKYGQFEGTGDITGFAPIMSQQIKKFVPDMSFVPENGSEFFTDAVKKKWLSIVPQGLGYVRVNDTRNYNNLPTPIEGYPASTFTTSMTHQLHCLHAIVEAFAAMSSNNTEKIGHNGDGWHLGHCFEYLRQGIMCCGDTALEGQQITFPDGVIGSDGWDAKHVCKDYSQILTHLETQRVNDDIWI